VWHWLASVFERYQLARCSQLTSIEEGIPDAMIFGKGFRASENKLVILKNTG